MNEAEKANQESDVFLKQVRLKNYKSIIDAEIDFKPGLNIIIGNNGSGKTNFLTYMLNVINIDWDELQVLLAEFVIKDNENLYKIKINKRSDFEPRIGEDWIAHYTKNIDVEFFINNKLDSKIETNAIDFDLFISKEINYNVKYIYFGVPNEQNIVEKSMQLTFFYNRGIFTLDTIGLIQTSFIKSIYRKLSLSTYYKNVSDDSKLNEIVNDLNVFFDNIKEALMTYTDIKDLRVSPNFNIYVNGDRKQIGLHNLYLEFYVNNNWIPYSYLSDGSKRLFYIVSEVLSYNQSDILKSFGGNTFETFDSSHNIILLEEPELGIHPHQLHKLMLFIKEQSKEKQIILTTHSPQVLNILDADELDRIIICNYDQEKGTQLKHLTEKQIKKGQVYMQDEGFLSDYWLHSDLEPAD